MGMVAAGAYLRGLREGEGLSQEELARRLGVAQKQLSRWERGEHEPAAPSLAALLAALKGNAEHVMRLLLDPEAGAKEGQALAQQHLTQAEVARIETTAAQVPDEHVQEMLDLMRYLRSDPEAFQKWIEYGEALLLLQEKRTREKPGATPNAPQKRRWRRRP